MMTTAELLAKAVLEAQGRIAVLTLQARENLSAQIGELQRAERLSTDADVLEQQRLSLAHEIEALCVETEALEARRSNIQESLRRKLDDAWKYLTRLYKLQAEEMRIHRTTQDFLSAMIEYTSELKGAGIEVQSATPAQLREKLPLLQRIASGFDAHARARAEAISQKLAEATHVHQTRLSSEERKKKLEYDLQQVTARLGSHSRTATQLQLLDDILTAEDGVLSRLRQEILDPLLRDLRIELEEGLSGNEPLKQLADVHRGT